MFLLSCLQGVGGSGVSSRIEDFGLAFSGNEDYQDNSFAWVGDKLYVFPRASYDGMVIDTSGPQPTAILTDFGNPGYLYSSRSYIPAGVAPNGYLYAMAGLNRYNFTTATIPTEILKIDPVTDTATVITGTGLPNNQCCAVMVGTKIYSVNAGFNNTPTNGAYITIFDTATDTFDTPIYLGTYQLTGQAYAFSAVAAPNGKVYIAFSEFVEDSGDFGFDQILIIDSADDSYVWTDFGIPSFHYAYKEFLIIGTKIYFLAWFGYYLVVDTTNDTAIQVSYPSTGSVSGGALLPDGRIIIASSSFGQEEFTFIDPSDNSWEQITYANKTGSAYKFVLRDNIFYQFPTSSTTNSVYRIDIASGIATNEDYNIAWPNVSPKFLQATLGPDNRIYCPGSAVEGVLIIEEGD